MLRILIEMISILDKFDSVLKVSWTYSPTTEVLSVYGLRWCLGVINYYDHETSCIMESFTETVNVRRQVHRLLSSSTIPYFQSAHGPIVPVTD